MNDDDRTTRTDSGSKDARSYTREQQTAADLADLRRMEPRHVLDCLGKWKPEALVAVLRQWIENGDEESAWLLCERLVVGIERVVHSRLKAAPWFDRDTREDILRDLAVRLYEEWRSRDAQHEFWEVQFWHCLGRRIVDVLRKHNPRDIPCDVHAPGWPEPVSGGVSTEEWAIAMLSLSRLPEKTRRVFVMKHYEGRTEAQIAQCMGVTSRTIRNWIRRAHEIMQERAGEDCR